MRQDKLDIDQNKIKEWIQNNLDIMLKIDNGEQEIKK